MELLDFRNDPKVRQLRKRSAELERERDDLHRAVESAQTALDRAQTRFDQLEALELVGDATSRELSRAKRDLVAAQEALQEVMGAAEEGRRRHARLMGQRSSLEDRARAAVRPKIEAALRDALSRHAAAAIALAESQKQLDVMRASIEDQFGVGVTYDGQARLRGWGSGPTGSPTLLPCMARFKDLPREVERFLAVAREEGIRA